MPPGVSRRAIGPSDLSTVTRVLPPGPASVATAALALSAVRLTAAPARRSGRRPGPDGGPDPVGYLRCVRVLPQRAEDHRLVTPYLRRVPGHHRQVSAHMRGQVGLVD